MTGATRTHRSAVQVRAFRRGTWQPSADTVALPGHSGRLSLSLVPEAVAVADRRRYEPPAGSLPPAARRKLIGTALGLLDRGTVTVGGLGEQSAADFRTALWETAGIPAALTDRWCGLLRAATPYAVEEPDGALALVSLPGNTFTCLESVLAEAARSAAVWVRPSRREPLSAARMVAALLEAGWPPERLGFYPTEQSALRTLVGLTDRQTVYGGAGLSAAVRTAIRTGASDRLHVRGPGRGCALLPPGTDPAGAVEWLLPLVAGDGGRFCSNVRTVVCVSEEEVSTGRGAEEAHAATRALACGVARRLAAALDAIRTEPVDDRLPLAAFRVPGEAGRCARRLREGLGPGDRMLTRRPPAARGTGGAEYALPALALLGAGAGPGHPLVGREVSFPFVAVLAASPAGAAAVAAGSSFVHRPRGGAL
ncbi:hypothetical protein GO001_12650 [Streptomyces sp. NRRL B-1677]|uniref:hypothetical protein n=1 Tax=Streptomyces sp. NRRL B-1677 TaxID=2682966 RepID=UPI001892C59C|nr:hypothetical protein [Streptomyces sp. NRRL B-1677]MBF6046070.1 hypothetical protein [Streptomyces sp. NRRL B-1677]